VVHRPPAAALCAVGTVPDLLFDRAHPGRIRARAGCRHRLSGVRLADDGAAAVAADAAAGHLPVDCGAPPADAVRKFRSGAMKAYLELMRAVRERGVRKL